MSLSPGLLLLVKFGDKLTSGIKHYFTRELIFYEGTFSVKENHGMTCRGSIRTLLESVHD